MNARLVGRREHVFQTPLSALEKAENVKSVLEGAFDIL